MQIENSDPRSHGTLSDVRKTAEMVQYHSPERIRSGQLSPADDTWAVAATLFSSITTARPFGELKAEVAARQPHGMPGLIAYGIQDQGLENILGNALLPEPSRRIGNVLLLRQHLEHWFGDPGAVQQLLPLDDEETGEEDQAATAMVPMEQILANSRPSSPSGAGYPPPPPVNSGPMIATPQASPLGEQDATVMRELPAHIMALAARAAGGSNPPPGPGPATSEVDSSDAEETGGATRVAHAPDLAAALLASRPAAGAPPTPPAGATAPRPPPRAMAPAPPTPRPAPGRPPRALRSTQLGVGAPVAPGAPQGPGPAPGFAPPPTTVSTNPPPRDMDDVRTVMHQVGEVASLLGNAGAGMPPMAAPAAPEIDDEDSDDGARTMLREAPSEEMMRAHAAISAAGTGYPEQPGPSAWQPAAPPVAGGGFGSGATDRPKAPTPAAGAPASPAALGGLIADSLGGDAANPAANQPPTENWGDLAGMVGGAPAGAPPGFPHQQGPAGPFAPMGGPFQPMGPSQGMGGGPNQPMGGPSQQHPHMGMGGHGGYPNVAPAEPLGAAPNSAQMMGEHGPPPGGYPLGAMMGAAPAPLKKKGSRWGLVVVCLLVLILAAALTFIFLRYRHLMMFLPPSLRGG